MYQNLTEIEKEKIKANTKKRNSNIRTQEKGQRWSERGRVKQTKRSNWEKSFEPDPNIHQSFPLPHVIDERNKNKAEIWL